MVVITHQMNVIEEICHRVAILDHGVIAEQGTVEEIFSHPQTEIGRSLVYPNGVQIDRLPPANVIRIAFNGGSSYEPLIASAEAGKALRYIQNQPDITVEEVSGHV